MFNERAFIVCAGGSEQRETELGASVRWPARPSNSRRHRKQSPSKISQSSWGGEEVARSGE